MKHHQYEVEVVWTGNRGEGTTAYTAYQREHEIQVAGKPSLPGSSDRHFRGDPTRYNPEELLVASLSACHMLWYLHLCSVNGVVVTNYKDTAHGLMSENSDGSGVFQEVTLRPRVVITAGSDREKAMSLHDEAHHMCFIANSVNFPVKNAPEISTAGSSYPQTNLGVPG